jgi:AraC-like DNA-binding protein/mannose-6-phosphate isomerase-like protein (cupin superfamily)
MVESKKSSKSHTNLIQRHAKNGESSSRGREFRRRVQLPKTSCKDHFTLVEPQINAEGVHLWPFNASCPADVTYLTIGDRNPVRMNRHRYFEVLYLCSGEATCHIQDRLLSFQEGDLAVIGSTLYHRIECHSDAPVTIAALFFEPDLICCNGGSDSAEYLTPFLLQDSTFPHIVSSDTGIPRQVLDMMLRIRAELPAGSPRARLAVKTYLKMLLLQLVNQYASYAGTVETFQRQQQALERLRPLFHHLGENCGSTIQVRDASRICGMSESHFMSFFKRATGLSFIAYINHYRVERAQLLLAKTEDSMVSVSQQVGFCDQSYFGTVFRRIVGMTPADYRRRTRMSGFGEQSELGHMPRLSMGNLPIPVSVQAATRERLSLASASAQMEEA